ncbi:MAG: glycosyltransferase involved in cell wall biosynthesis [Hyphomicrobiaceae bacterium]|jgi:glycosyltransferase involved in cell wall biosynthesis
MPNRREGQPLISIITVVLDRAEVLPRTLQSINEQSFRDFEHIVVDGGSSDGTFALLESSPVVTRWVSEPDNGIFDAMNKGAALAQGRWLYFIGSDDVLDNANVLALVAERLKSPDTVYYGNVVLASSGRCYNGEFTRFRLANSNVCHQAVFYPRRVFSRYRYNTKYRTVADWVLNMQCFADRSLRNEHVPLTICRYDDVSGQSSLQSDEDFRRDYPTLLRQNFPAWIVAWYSALLLGGRALRRLGFWT